MPAERQAGSLCTIVTAPRARGYRPSSRGFLIGAGAIPGMGFVHATVTINGVAIP